MSKGLIDKVANSFRPQAPLWACEFTSQDVIVAGVQRRRDKLVGKSSASLSPQSVVGSLLDRNIQNIEEVRRAVGAALNESRFEGSEIGVVIPDDSTRITFLSAENLPRDTEEQKTFVRWRLRKTVPFDVDSAQVALRVLGPHYGNGLAARAGAVDLLVALSPREIIEEFETVLGEMDLHAGFVVPSTLAALNLYSPPPDDALFVKVAPNCITTTVFQGQQIKFHRRVSETSLYDAIYPTILYYQDKLGGSAVGRLTICEYDSAIQTSLMDLQQKLEIPIERLQPSSINDIFKPALGAVHLAWQTLI